MKSILKLAVALVALCLLPSTQAALKLYASGGSGLYTIDPATGAATLACNFNGMQVYAGGLAYDAATDTMYATGIQSVWLSLSAKAILPNLVL